MAVNGIDEAAFEQQQWSNPNVSDTCKGWCIFCWIDNCYNRIWWSKRKSIVAFSPCSQCWTTMIILMLIFHRLRLNTMTLQVTSNNVYSAQGVAISVTGIAQVHNKLNTFDLNHLVALLFSLWLYCLMIFPINLPIWMTFSLNDWGPHHHHYY